MANILELIIKAEDGASGVIGNVNKAVGNLGLNFKDVALAAGVLGGALSALTANAVHAANAAIELRNMSIETGFSVDSLGKLQYIAEVSGKSIDTVTIAIRYVARSMDEARNPTSRVAQAFRELGLSMGELSQLAPEDLFYSIALAVADISDPVERAGYAMRIFGERGISILPVLDDLANKMDEASRKAVMTPEQIAQGVAAHTAIVNLSTAWGNFTQKLAITTFPALESILNLLIQILDVAIPTLNALERVLETIYHYSGTEAFLGLLGVPRLTSYQSGGTVPGPLGAPVPVIAHGGERFLGQGGGGTGVTIIQNIGGSVVAERELVRMQRQALLDIKRQNVTTGL